MICKHCLKQIKDNKDWEYYYPARERTGAKAHVKIHAKCKTAMIEKIVGLYKKYEQ